MKKSVVVGMSGGVDSTVCVHLLKEAGYEVIGVTLELWRDEPGCCEDAYEAAAGAKELGIAHHIVHGKRAFEEAVVDYFISEYRSGRTPNPCVRCNPTIKWRLLLEAADSLGADFVATGHYAVVKRQKSGRYGIFCAVDKNKDQSYVLSQLGQRELSRTILPLGDYTKPKIREIARSLGLTSADKKDSQDICFIDNGDYGAFLAERLGHALPPEGDFVMSDGTVVGRHRGITNYTIGQRKGLGIALGERVFVNRIDVEKNQVVLGTDGEVYSDRLVADSWNMISVEEVDQKKTYLGRIRYSNTGKPCHCKRLGADEYEVSFDEPIRGITPGQTVAIYDGDMLIAGGVIR